MIHASADRSTNEPSASVPAHDFTHALAAAANGVSVVTARAGEVRAGLTVSSMCSVCAEPALLLACVNEDNEFCRIVDRSGGFAVNILESRHVRLASVFAGIAELDEGASRFDIGDWTRLRDDGAPVLADALVSLDCALDSSFVRGTHRVFIGRVLAVTSGPGVPLVYTDRGWARTHPLDVTANSG